MRKRTTFYFPAEAAKQLGQIKRRTRMESGAAVLRAALSAYAELLEVSQAGYQIAVRTKDGETYPFSPYEPFDYPGLTKARSEDAALPVDDKTPKNFVFPEAAAEKLTAIRRASYLESNADAIRAALASYDELTLVTRAGDRILIADGDEEVPYTPYAPLPRTRLHRLPPLPQGEIPRTPEAGDNATAPFPSPVLAKVT